MYDGVEVKIADKTFIVPPLNLKSMRQLLPRIEKLNENKTSLPTDEDVQTMLEAVHSALKRNYPEITIDEVEELVDIGNMRFLMRIVFGQSGLALGNAQAEAPKAEAPTQQQ